MLKNTGDRINSIRFHARDGENVGFVKWGSRREDAYSVQSSAQNGVKARKPPGNRMRRILEAHSRAGRLLSHGRDVHVFQVTSTPREPHFSDSTCTWRCLVTEDENLNTPGFGSGPQNAFKGRQLWKGRGKRRFRWKVGKRCGGLVWGGLRIVKRSLTTEREWELASAAVPQTQPDHSKGVIPSSRFHSNEAVKMISNQRFIITFYK